MKKIITILAILIFFFSCSKSNDESCDCETISTPDNVNRVSFAVLRPCEFDAETLENYLKLGSQEQLYLQSKKQGCRD